MFGQMTAYFLFTSSHLPLSSSLSDIIYTTGPTQIRHIEGERAITLQIKPADNVALEEAIDKIQEKVVNQLENEGLPSDVTLDILYSPL